jgi:hypothetical protein
MDIRFLLVLYPVGFQAIRPLPASLENELPFNGGNKSNKGTSPFEEAKKKKKMKFVGKVLKTPKEGCE